MPRKVYEFERILTSVDNQQILKRQGYTPFFSSNVSAGQRKDNDLYIRFHNGSVYKYPGSGDMFEDLILSSSKGKWVWANLRRANKPYTKVGSLPLDGDRDLTDEELLETISRQILKVIPIDILKPQPIPMLELAFVTGLTNIDQLTLGLLLTTL